MKKKKDNANAIARAKNKSPAVMGGRFSAF